ncbi:hypothetical protein [Pedobacter nyackensis]|uniref:hypothetical protein n=1 Tax=Pedobacter nyackensis TaxID=475255 RepID=UPI00292CD08F|nr:hypothetical protein [Pedobacter nyackensis]
MKSLNRTFRLICLSLLIILASIGVGIAGGIAIPLSRKKDDEPVQIELPETNREHQENSTLEAFKQ